MKRHTYKNPASPVLDDSTSAGNGELFPIKYRETTWTHCDTDHAMVKQT